MGGGPADDGLTLATLPVGAIVGAWVAHEHDGRRAVRGGGGDRQLPPAGSATWRAAPRQERDDLVTAIYEAERALQSGRASAAARPARRRSADPHEPYRKAATAPGGRGRRSGDARRRIPAVAANQVAGTWLSESSYHRRAVRGKRPGRHRRSERRRSTVLDGQMSSNEHAAQRGVRARQTRRPWRIIRRLKSPRSSGGR